LAPNLKLRAGGLNHRWLAQAERMWNSPDQNCHCAVLRSVRRTEASDGLTRSRLRSHGRRRRLACTRWGRYTATPLPCVPSRCRAARCSAIARH